MIRTGIWLATMLLVLVAGMIAGCGEKIAIPEATGLFSVTGYGLDGTYSDPDGPRQLTLAQGFLFVLTENSLTKRGQGYDPVPDVPVVAGLLDARAICVDERQQIVFVWEQGTQTVSWYSTALEVQGFTDLPDVQSAVSMATCPAGIDQVPGARTYLYIADPDSGVIHRYAFDEGAGLSPHGILARSDGDAVRFVHEPAGMIRDHEDSLLVCDADTSRNWVIRFMSEPDLADTTSGPDDPDPLRGYACLFDEATCVPPAATDYVLGNAAICNQTDWVGGTSSVEGEFNAPAAVAVDGLGRIFVTDRGNDRVQIFQADGTYELLFGSSQNMMGPTSLALLDVNRGGGVVHYAAFVYVVIPESSEVRRFISNEHYYAVNGQLPHPEN